MGLRQQVAEALPLCRSDPHASEGSGPRISDPPSLSRVYNSHKYEDRVGEDGGAGAGAGAGLQVCTLQLFLSSLMSSPSDVHAHQLPARGEEQAGERVGRVDTGGERGEREGEAGGGGAERSRTIPVASCVGR
eukprot:746493-Hanusia_phi.AAC.1